MKTFLKKVDELSLCLLRMSLENHNEFFKADWRPSVLTCSSAYAAVNLIKNQRVISQASLIPS